MNAEARFYSGTGLVIIGMIGLFVAPNPIVLGVVAVGLFNMAYGLGGIYAKG